MHLAVQPAYWAALATTENKNVPNPGDGSRPPGAEKFETIMSWGKWAALGVCVMALIFAGAKLGLGNRHGDGSEHAGRIGSVLIGTAIVAGAFSIIGFLAG